MYDVYFVRRRREKAFDLKRTNAKPKQVGGQGGGNYKVNVQNRPNDFVQRSRLSAPFRLFSVIPPHLC